MVTIKVHENHPELSVNDFKTTVCPKCGIVVNSWKLSSDECKGCGYKLININSLVLYQFARINYHKEGTY